MSDEYKSLRTVIFEVQVAAAPQVVSSSKPQKSERKKVKVGKPLADTTVQKIQQE